MCHMGSDRKVRRPASTLIQDLYDKWAKCMTDTINISCPFVKELKDSMKIDCKCDVCLADSNMCEQYRIQEKKIMDEFTNMSVLLARHILIYQKSERGD